MLLATSSSGAATRVHTVGQIVRDGKAVDSAEGVTVTPASGPAQHVLRRGETIADGTRVDVPAHVVVVIVSTGGASTARLEPGASLTFVSTGRGEVVRSNAGQTLFDVVHNALDFYRVQYGDQISAGVSGTAFSVVASGKTVTFVCTRDQINVTKTGYLVIGAERKKVALIDVISAANRRQVTYEPSATWYFASFANFAAAQASYRAQVAAAQRGGDAATLAAAVSNLGFVDAALGKYPAALQAQQQALALYRRAGDRDGEARALDNLGVVQRNLGRFDDAYTTQQAALALLRGSATVTARLARWATSASSNGTSNASPMPSPRKSRRWRCSGNSAIAMERRERWSMPASCSAICIATPARSRPTSKP